MTSKLKDFFERGEAYIKAAKSVGKSPTAINPTDNPQEWEAWETYFLSRYGDTPEAWEMVLRRQSPSFTVPVQWPDVFDSSYKPPSRHLQKRREWMRPDPSPEERARVTRQMERFQAELEKLSHSMRRETAKPGQQERAQREREAAEAVRAAARARGEVHIEPFSAESVAPSSALLNMLGQPKPEAAA